MLKTWSCTVGGLFTTNKRMICLSEEANSTPIVEDEDLCDADVHAIILCQENMELRNQKTELQICELQGEREVSWEFNLWKGLMKPRLILWFV